MFAIQDYVLYRSNGVCRITDIRRECFSGTDSREYYVLNPVFDVTASRIFVPTDGPQCMELLLSAEQIQRQIEQMPEQSDYSWIVNDAERSAHFRSILETGSRMDIIRMIKTIYHHNRALQKAGRKPRVTDEAVFRRAEKKIYEEIAVALELEPSEVVPYIVRKLNAESPS